MEIHSIRFKLIASLLCVSLFIGLFSVLVGGNLLYQSVIDEAGNRISQDLNVAQVIYDDRIDSVRLALEITASASELGKAVSSTGPKAVVQNIKSLFSHLKLDFSGIYCLPKDSTTAYTIPNPMVLDVLKIGRTISGTMVLNQDQLAKEDVSLAKRARIQIKQSSSSTHKKIKVDETRGLAIGAAVPIFADNKLVGVIYGGFLLNKDTDIVDKIGETIFKNEIYKGKNVGTSTIFLKDLRIATSVKIPSGQRALGTFASPEVTGQVLDKGELWTDRAKVLDNWYIAAYEPIIDINGQRVGMFYVGVLEAKYWDI